MTKFITTLLLSFPCLSLANGDSNQAFQFTEKQLFQSCTNAGEDPDKLDEYSVPTSGTVRYEIWMHSNSYGQSIYTMDVFVDDVSIVEGLLVQLDSVSHPSDFNGEIHRLPLINLSPLSENEKIQYWANIMPYEKDGKLRTHLQFGKVIKADGDTPRKVIANIGLARLHCE